MNEENKTEEKKTEDENVHPWAKGKEKKVTKDPREKKAAKKVALIVVIATAVLLLLTLLSKIDFSPVIDTIFGEKKTESKIKFALPDYDEDIMQDKEYLGMTRLISYTEGAQTALLNEEDYGQYNEFLNFMHEYFGYIIAGDAKSYNACFTERYLKDKKNEKKERFTMQRIYEPCLTYIRSEVENPNSDDEKTHVYYIVEYKIQKNNGTFRDDMGSDCSKAEVYDLVRDEKTETILIDSIVKKSAFKG